MARPVAAPSVAAQPAAAPERAPHRTRPGREGRHRSDRSAATSARALVAALIGPEPPVRIEFWDGSSLGPADAVGTLHVRSADAIRRILWSPDELGVGRAYVTGSIDVDGDVFEVIGMLREAGKRLDHRSLKAVPKAIVAARRIGAFGGPLPAPPEEAHAHGWRHSKQRDAEVVSHHYDVGNDFYRLVLGEAMTYSCARWADLASDPVAGLAGAQAAKHELVSRKLGLHEHDRWPGEQGGARLLDVGCGWGSMAIHAAREHGASVVGITISKEQAERARERVADAGLADRIEIRLQDYRDLGGEQFDAISSIGMFEHVGSERIGEYFATLRPLLAPRGRLLNHAISAVRGSKIDDRSFMGRYVFPDGELIDVGEVVLAMERAGFEVRDVESLREHYARTLRAWVANLDARWDDAVELVGDARARVWRLYMAGSAIGFEDGGIGIHQVLGVVQDDEGRSGMPPSQASWA